MCFDLLAAVQKTKQIHTSFIKESYGPKVIINVYFLCHTFCTSFILRWPWSADRKYKKKQLTFAHSMQTWTTYNIIKVTITCNLCKCNDITFFDKYNFGRPSFIEQPTSLCNIIIKLLTIQNDNIHLTWEVYGKSELVSHFKFCQVPVPCISTCYKLHWGVPCQYHWITTLSKHPSYC